MFETEREEAISQVAIQLAEEKVVGVNNHLERNGLPLVSHSLINFIHRLHATTIIIIRIRIIIITVMIMIMISKSYDHQVASI